MIYIYINDLPTSMSLLEDDQFFWLTYNESCCSQQQRNDAMFGKMREPGGHTMYCIYIYMIIHVDPFVIS